MYVYSVFSKYVKANHQAKAPAFIKKINQDPNRIDTILLQSSNAVP